MHSYALTGDQTCNLGESGRHSHQLSYLARANLVFIEMVLFWRVFMFNWFTCHLVYSLSIRIGVL